VLKITENIVYMYYFVSYYKTNIFSTEIFNGTNGTLSDMYTNYNNDDESSLEM